MAGAGDVLGPGEDETLVASRSAAFRVELGATTEVTQLFAHRAAVLSIRMERLANRELVAVAEARAVAQLQFDEEAAPERNRWIAGLAAGTASYRDVTRALEGSPAGLLALIDAWETALVEATADGSAVADRARSRLNSWLGLGETSGEVADRSRRMRAEVERLRGLADSQDALADQVARSRERRATLASFDTSAEATLARRYEAAAERGVYRALRTIQELNQGSKVHSAPLAELAPKRSTATEGSAPALPNRELAAIAAPPARESVPDLVTMLPAVPGPASPLGSFRAAARSVVPSLHERYESLLEPSLIPIPPRKPRPDLRKLARNR